MRSIMTNAIILGAGFGSRLLPLTKDKPKPLIKFAKKTLLDRNIEIFKKYGINDISVVVGYKKEKITLPNITYFENKNYQENSTLSSLFCAEKKILDSTIIVYSDVIFQENVLEKLLNNNNDISVVIDQKWVKYWKLRNNQSIYDATESAIFNEQNIITTIGKKNTNANGLFIGLMKLQNNGSKKFQELYHKIKENYSNNNNELNKNLSFEKLRIVDLLEGLIKLKYPIHSILIDNGWLEFDTISDYELYSDMYNKNILSKLIKLDS